MTFFKVWVANTFCNKYYTYSFQESLELYQIVLVEFGYKKCFGVIVEETDAIKDSKLILQVFSYCLNPLYIEFIQKSASYYFNNIGAMLELALPSIAFKKSLPILLEYQGQPFLLADLLKMLLLKEVRKLKRLYNEFKDRKLIEFSDDQIKAIEYINNSEKLVCVLEGVTGSGKTLVALESFKKFKNKILILVPEISLASNWEAVIKKYFDIIPFVYHSKMSQAYKKSFFNWAISDESGIVIGTRSSLMIPYKDLECIIIDEEHSTSYRQESYPYYHARDMGVLMASILKIKVLLMSATPSLETVLNIKKKKYDFVKLSRTPKYGLASISCIKCKAKEILHPIIINEVLENFKKKQQVLFFLNRKGYFPYCACNQCHGLLSCLNCDANLTFYKGFHIVCHKCLKKSFLPKKCPLCGALTTWSFWGIGVQKLHEYLENIFLDYKFSVITCDSDDIKEQMHQIENKAVDGIIATQILAQGHDFKHISLVIVVDADMGLFSTDYRVMEHMYQLWQQLRGRSGRHNIKGKMILQYFKKENKFIDLFQKDNVMEFLLNDRKINDWPPFSKCAFVKFKDKNKEKLQKTVDMISFSDENIFGPLYYGLVNKVFEFRFLVKAHNYIILKSILERIKQQYPKCEIEIDPY